MAGKRGAWYPWLLLVGGALVSVTANAIQAAMSASVEVPHVMAAAVAAVPPIVLLAITHLTVVLTRTDDDQAPISATSESSPRPVSVTEPAATSELALPGPPLMPVAELVSPESSSPSGSDLMSIFAINDELVDENQEARERSRTWELEQAKQMRSEGMSFSSIGKALGRDGTTISRWLREPEAAGE